MVDTHGAEAGGEDAVGAEVVVVGDEEDSEVEAVEWVVVAEEVGVAVGKSRLTSFLLIDGFCRKLYV